MPPLINSMSQGFVGNRVHMLVALIDPEQTDEALVALEKRLWGDPAFEFVGCWPIDDDGEERPRYQLMVEVRLNEAGTPEDVKTALRHVDEVFRIRSLRDLSKPFESLDEYMTKRLDDLIPPVEPPDRE